MSDPVIQVWTAPKSAGGVPLGPLPLLLNDGRLTIAQAVSGAQGVSGTTTKPLADDAGLAEGAWLRIVDATTGTSEWLVSSVSDADGQGRDRVQFQAVPLRQVLTVRGRIRTVPTTGSPVTSFTPGSRTVDALMLLYYTPNLAEDDLSWFAYAGSEYSGTIDIGSIANWTRAQLLDAIERRTGYEWQVTNDGDSGYTLTLVRRVGSDAETQRLSPGVEIDRLERVRDIMTAATVVDPVTSTGTAIGEPCWRVRQITEDSGTWWVAVEDPAGGPAVIREDGQLVDAWLVPRDGAPVQILDARSSDSALQVGAIAGVVVGSLVTLWETAEGRLIASLTSPSGLGSTRGRIVQSVQGASPYTSRNMAPDPLFRAGLAGWEYFDPATTYDEQTQSFSRDDPVKTTGAAAGGESIAATSIDMDGLPPGFAIRTGEVVQVDGVRYECDTLTVVPANGQATIPITGTLSATIAGDVSLVRRVGSTSYPVRTNGSNTSGASSLTLKDLTASTALAASDQLQTLVGGEGQVAISAITPVAGPAHDLTITPLLFDIASSVVLRVTENQYALGEYYGGVQISALSGTLPSFTATVAPIPVDIPGDTNIVISEVRRQLVGGRTQVVTYTAALDGDYTADSTTMDLYIPGRPAEGVFVFQSASASYQSARRTRAVTYDITMTSGYTAGGSTITGTGTRPIGDGWFFDYASARYNGTTLRTYTISGTPSLWSTGGTSTATITGTLSETLAAGTALRWIRSGVLLGDLVIDTTATGGGNTIALRGGSFVKYVQIGETFELPAFTTYTTAPATADGSGVVTLSVLSTAAAIADNVAISIVRCPDYASDEPGSANVLRLVGATGTGTTATSFSASQYRQAGIFAYYAPPQRVIVPAGQTLTLRARLAYTLWATAASQVVNCRMVLWNVTATTPTILAEVSIVTGSTTAIPYTADLQTTTHGEIALNVDLTASTRVVLSIYPYSISSSSWLFGRNLSMWVGDADVPTMDGADNNALWHKAQDRLEGGALTARYRANLSPTYHRVADDPLTMGALVRIPSTWLGVDVTARLLRVVQTYPRTTQGPVVELDVLRPLLSES